MSNNPVDQFLEAAVRLERDSALRYDELAYAIAGHGRDEVVAFFRQQAAFSRRHLQQAEARISKHEPWGDAVKEDAGNPADVAFPDGESPEATAIWATDAQLSVEDAIALALEAEERGHAYYARIAATTKDPEVRVLAEEFTKEEAEHVQMLKDLTRNSSKFKSQ